jgi:hypothetical protein
MNRPTRIRRLRRSIQRLADALQVAVGIADELAQHAQLTVRDALDLTLRLRRAARVLQQLRPKGGTR